ncbi:hypothetical protein C0992_010938 [Termitomyces sp. T32_za158]|nr:hypothetical protein C0992_010938 [Termitomyces sp. T32_za158]
MDDHIPPNTNHPAPAPRRVLTLTSYAHRRGPLVPAPSPGLAFDVRALPNPPKRIRDACVGTHNALRAAFMADSTCRQRVDDIHSAVIEALRQFDTEEDDDDDDDEAQPLVLHVGVCCEMGRHRSVACVEALARAAWPAGWDVEIVHRDLKRQRSERDKEKRSRKVERLEESD